MLPVLVIRPWLSGLSWSGFAFRGSIIPFTVHLDLFYHVVLLPTVFQKAIYYIDEFNMETKQSCHSEVLVSKPGYNDLVDLPCVSKSLCFGFLFK